MELTGSQRQQLHGAMLQAYDSPSLAMFLNFNLNLIFQAIVSDAPFAVQCFELIMWAEREGRIEALCRAMDQTSQNPALKRVLATLLQPGQQSASSSDPQVRPFLIQKRPILDRVTLWNRLVSFADAAGNERILFISGSPATGKTYSRYLVSHACRRFVKNSRFVLLDLKEEESSEVTGPVLALRIADRLWPTAPLSVVDSVAQPARQVRQLGDRLIGRLAGLQQPTWLMIDALNRDLIEAPGSVTGEPSGPLRADRSALQLLLRLCNAVDLGECPQLWLILVGACPTQFDPELAAVLTWEEISRPTSEDIHDYLAWVARQLGRSHTESQLLSDARELAAALPEQMSHQAWRAFHKALGSKCSAL